MKAIKANKEYAVTEENKDFYVRLGFDIVDDDGKVLEYGKGKKIEYSEYQKLWESHEGLVKENETLHERIKKLESQVKNIEGPVQKKDLQKKAGD